EIIQETKGQKPHINECLEKFNAVRFMKLLYFTCLESCSDFVEGKSENTLFDLFDDFLAYEKGPVEIDVYSYYRSILPRYVFNGQFLIQKPIYHKDGDINNKAALIEEELIIYPELRKDQESDTAIYDPFESSELLIKKLIDNEANLEKYVQMAKEAVERLKKSSLLL
ncbi:MAG: hypothetical protein LIO97_06730, partial [Tannerellaceae bacterium]|nr:hypothetical protein [Tannerellaceae bacterium]